MIEKIENYWEGWHQPPPHWYGISVSAADSFSSETKDLQQKLMRMSRLRRRLSFRMRRELRRRKQTEFIHAVMQRGEEAMTALKGSND